MLVWVGRIENRSNSDSVRSQEPSRIKAISHKNVARNLLSLPFTDTRSRLRAVTVALEFVVLQIISSYTSAHVFTPFAKIFLPWALKNGRTSRRNNPLNILPIHSIYCLIRVSAKICLPQIRVSLPHSLFVQIASGVATVHLSFHRQNVE